MKVLMGEKQGAGSGSVDVSSDHYEDPRDPSGKARAQERRQMKIWMEPWVLAMGVKWTGPRRESR